MVTSGERPAEEIQPLLDGGGERNDDAGHRRAVGLADVVAVNRDIGVIEHVAHDVLLEDLFPQRVIVRGRLVRADAEEFLAQREDGAVGIRVVDAEAAFNHRPIVVQLA